MGYTTDFEGTVSIEPPLNVSEISFLTEFNETRRMHRSKGPLFVRGSGAYGQGDDEDIIDNNRPHPDQPGLWCQWTPSNEGHDLEWDGGEKFYNSVEWMRYIIDHFLKPGAIAKNALPFLQANHVCNGEIEAEGESGDDHWKLVVENNKVGEKQGRVVFDD